MIDVNTAFDLLFCPQVQAAIPAVMRMWRCCEIRQMAAHTDSKSWECKMQQQMAQISVY